ncbi:MAG: ABC transporter permease [Chloroflexi bacterium]|nr:ABC transporter permease [Chloroflexota bacterium]
MATNTRSADAVARLGDDPAAHLKSESLTRRALRRIRHDRLTLIALITLALITVLVVLADPICRHILQVDPETTNPQMRLLPPGSPGHILGTDDLGRDYAARLLYGGQISLAIGFFGSVITLTIGVLTGLIAGYFGGRVDDLMNWVITTLDSIPSIYLLLLLSTILTRSAVTLVIVIAMVGWTGGTRLVRGQTIQLRGMEFVISAKAMGASSWRIMLVHIFPNTLSLMFLSLAGGIGGLMLTEATLSFLKLGVQPPTPTWGNMLSNAQQFFTRGPHMATVSGLLIFVTVLCLFVIGDGLRDAFDPRIND